LAWLLPAQAQQQGPQFPTARLANVMPPGGKAGSSFEVTVTGPDLDDAKELLFSHPGIKAERLPDTGKPEPPKNPPNQPAPVSARFKVTIPPDAPHGVHDVRVVGKWGLTNPRAFAVGGLDEVTEKEPNNDVPQAEKVALNTTISGTISANTDVDYFTFAGQKGQRVLLHCAAFGIDSRASPLVQLIGPGDHELASARRAQEDDPVI